MRGAGLRCDGCCRCASGHGWLRCGCSNVWGGGCGRGGADGGGPREKQKEVDNVCVADLTRADVHVCFEGPLGAHLKQEMRERIWRDEYVEIISLLPLEKFNLDKRKPDESKKEEEEKRR